MASILLVDDEKNIRELAALVLKKAGHQVVAADSGDAAMTAANNTHFDLMLLDYMMPAMDGFQFLEKASVAALRLPPVVFMTAYGSVETAVKALKSGASDYLSKPFTTDELLHIVQRNLRTQQLQQQVADLERQVRDRHLAKSAGLTSGNLEVQSLSRLQNRQPSVQLLSLSKVKRELEKKDSRALSMTVAPGPTSLS